MDVLDSLMHDDGIGIHAVTGDSHAGESCSLSYDRECDGERGFPGAALLRDERYGCITLDGLKVFHCGLFWRGTKDRIAAGIGPAAL